ncbi:hypothetical protein MKEN_00362300 [Mycena kentingensis (nom. inval.)]|nr:hypothetical protein MKEN_00362300 [Mycena kentingensis (nom. inval.)]
MSNQSHELPRIRTLGYVEQYHLVRNFVGFDSCILVSAQYTASDGARFSPRTLYPALRSLIEVHTPLGIRFEGDEANGLGHWVRLPSVDLSRIVEFSEMKTTSTNLECVLEAQFARGFATMTDLPLWRVLVLTDNTVVAALHHAIADGLSGRVFHSQMLRALQKGHADAEDASPIVPVPQTLAMIPPIEQGLNVRPSLMLALSALYMLWTAFWLPGKSWTGTVCAKVPDITSHVRIVKISAADTQKLLVACRAHKATLTSAAHVLLACVVSQLIARDTSASKFQRIETLIALSMRAQAGVGEDEITDCAAAIYPVTRVCPMFSWADAADVAKQLKAQWQAKEMIGMLGFLEGKLNNYFRGKLGKKRDLGYLITNLGRWPAEEEKVDDARWTLANMVFAQCDVPVGAAFKCCIVGDPSGAVNIAFVRGDGIDGEFMEQLISLFEEEVSRLL